MSNANRIPVWTEASRIAAVREHANTHYDSGWDIVAEAMTDKEIAEATKGCRSGRESIARMRQIVRIHREQERAARNEIF